MAETADYDPGGWKGHSFKDARKTYDVHVGRSYADANASGKRPEDLIPTFVETTSEAPLIVMCDVTGSMGTWPAVIFSKLPYLDIEGKSYLGEDMEICFGAIGDATSDKYPFQIREFGTGTVLSDRLKELIIEGNGGGQFKESYELAALYCARNVRMPRAVQQPILIIIGDEGLYDYVEKRHANMINVGIEGSRIDTKDIFTELKTKFSTYVVRKPYGDRHEAEIQRQWVQLLGEDHVVSLPGPDRVVDVIFGILARETGKVDYFHSEIEGRQTKEQVETVYKSLENIHANLPSKPKSGHSIMVLPGSAGAKKSKHLLPPKKK